MTKTIDYYFTLRSPWSYLGGPRLEEIARRHGATINHKPIDVAGKVFPVSGGLALPKRAPQRKAYRLAEMRRWRDFLGMPLTLEPKFATATEWPGRGMIIAAALAGLDCGPLVNGLMRAHWAEESNIDDPDTARAIADAAGLDGEKLIAQSESPAVLAQYDANTQEAIQRNVFGVPAYIFGDDLFWGQDRLDFLDRALAAT